MTENNRTERIQIRITKKDKELYQKFAKERGLTLSAFINMCCMLYILDQENKKGV